MPSAKMASGTMIFYQKTMAKPKVFSFLKLSHLKAAPK